MIFQPRPEQQFLIAGLHWLQQVDCFGNGKVSLRTLRGTVATILKLPMKKEWESWIRGVCISNFLHKEMGYLRNETLHNLDIYSSFLKIMDELSHAH